MVRATKILGLAKLQRKLDRLPEIAKQHITEALEKAADEIVRMAKSLVPVLKTPDERRRAGALRDSIGWTWGKVPKGAMTLGKVAESALGGDLTITIYAGTRDKSSGVDDAFYARWVEFGTQKMQAQPYFFPSYRANKKPAARRIRAGVRKAAKAAASS
ncbi:HK97 gp10 family phage protein [Shinella daejeonensis]|uniref:HK97-gp10 family putative phage morphogenesis protein n=1 Tax=Shinella daejeonensis TaxID=659017 RepID=UPI0020C82423|nr:HK97-gp10 family putative phage morphogenesis protein [Shinella daejeonensis]MCP8894296.1 HK97 gp10 family phage protein [Shinella daejeonensis]